MIIRYRRPAPRRDAAAQAALGPLIFDVVAHLGITHLVRDALRADSFSRLVSPILFPHHHGPPYSPTCG